MKQPSLEIGYRRIVRTRKADFSLAKYNLTNPSETPYDCHHLGSYAQWAGDLPAKVLVILQDNRCIKAFTQHHGKPANCTPLPDGTLKWKREINRDLHYLLQSIGLDIGLPHAPKSAGVFIADAVPFLRKGPLCDNTAHRTLQYTTAQYIVPLIELINPPVIISVGIRVTRALFEHYNPQPFSVIPNADPKDYLARILCAPHSINNGRSQIFPVFHPGRVLHIPKRYGENFRDFENMVRDWARIGRQLSDGQS